MLKATNQSGITFPLSNDLTLLDCALKSGFTFNYSCKNGKCGACKAAILEGIVTELKPQLSLSEKERADGYCLMCCCSSDENIVFDAAEISELRNIDRIVTPAKISNIYLHTEDIIEVSLRLPPSVDFQFLSGQYIEVMKGTTRRSYSIASSNNECEIKLIIKKVPTGEMSNYWFNEAKPGDLLRIDGPQGTFFLRKEVSVITFLATGTGIAPVMSMLNELDIPTYQNSKPEINLYWGNRNEEDFFWTPELKHIDINFIKVCSKPSNSWSSKVGYVQEHATTGRVFDQSHYVFACGNINMISDARTRLIQCKLPSQNFFSDAFVSS